MCTRIIICLVIIGMGVSCSNKEAVYSWQTTEESRTLALTKDNRFILNIQGGYYNRIDTGTYQVSGDTLILNPDKIKNSLDSIVALDSLFNGQRFIEVYEEIVEVDAHNAIQGSTYSASIFPSVIVNNTLSLSLSPDDQSYHKLILPDSVAVRELKVNVREDNTCKPLVTFRGNVPADKQTAKSYQLFVRSSERRENYLAGFKWLLKSDTIESFFSSDSCESTHIKMVRK
jgi:hypothetical protein